LKAPTTLTLSEWMNAVHNLEVLKDSI